MVNNDRKNTNIVAIAFIAVLAISAAPAMAIVALGIVEFGLDLAVGDNTSAAADLLCLFPMGKGFKYVTEIGGDAIKGGSKAKNLYKAEGLLKMDLQLFGKRITQAERLIPGTPGVVTGGNSTKLGRNIMESMGLKRSTKWTGYQAQHIIPAEMAKNPIIKKIGMNLDDATNGILLRTPDAELSAMSRHRGYHSVYNDVVRNQLNKMDANQSVDVLRRKVFDLQTDLRKLQESGLPLYPSQGATVDLWERSLSRIRK
ncbi:AHH domain-containing protein [Clostridium botulinum]|uniref:AHH domain-containing protein n=1 Tax=Clostridium botulinum TaxID=1491 RepID=UPI0018FEE50E|nr:AHH domain-containing protein [Clostridium botulinum]